MLVLNEPDLICLLSSHKVYFRNQVLAASVYHLPKYYKLACEKIPISNPLGKIPSHNKPVHPGHH